MLTWSASFLWGVASEADAINKIFIRYKYENQILDETVEAGEYNLPGFVGLAFCSPSAGSIFAYVK